MENDKWDFFPEYASSTIGEIYFLKNQDNKASFSVVLKFEIYP